MGESMPNNNCDDALPCEAYENGYVLRWRGSYMELGKEVYTKVGSYLEQVYVWPYISSIVEVSEVYERVKGL